jgi:hypothetical protein
LEHWGFGFVSDFERRISDLPGSVEPGGLASFFTPPAFLGQKRGKLGLFGALATLTATVLSSLGSRVGP